MSKRILQAMTLAGLLGAVGFVTGCEERRQPAETEEGVGGAGREEGPDIGEQPGVLRDGEGPLERQDTRPGEQPGFMNDGEGPIEERTGQGGAGNIGDRPGVIRDGEGPLEEQNRPGERPGVMNDGEGPVEKRE